MMKSALHFNTILNKKGLQTTWPFPIAPLFKLTKFMKLDFLNAFGWANKFQDHFHSISRLLANPGICHMPYVRNRPQNGRSWAPRKAIVGLNVATPFSFDFSSPSESIDMSHDIC
jgi:hypothetical protein